MNNRGTLFRRVLSPQRCQAVTVAMLFGLCSFATAAAAITPAPPPINARSHILIDFDSGEILAEANADELIEPASITKLMTAHVIFDALQNGTISLNDEVHVSKKAWRMPGSRMFIEVDTKVPLEELLQGMIVQSGNDATVALAEYVAGSEETFVDLMNQHARQLGLTGTHFTNSTGLPDKEHHMTTRDIALLAQATIHEFPDYYAWYAEREFSFNNIKQYNRNKLLWRDPTVDGIKTGHTESAGYCLVASALRDGMRLIAVVIGTDSEDARAREAEKLLNYGFRFYETHQLYAVKEPLTTARVWKGENEELPLGVERSLYVTIPRGRYDALKATLSVDNAIVAPVARNEPRGRVTISLDGKNIAERPLVALEAVPEGGLVTRMVDEVRLLFE